VINGLVMEKNAGEGKREKKRNWVTGTLKPVYVQGDLSLGPIATYTEKFITAIGEEFHYPETNNKQKEF